jgi:hypothetical protein
VLKDYGSIGAFSFIAFCMLIVATVISGFGPRTNSLSLEEINRIVKPRMNTNGEFKPRKEPRAEDAEDAEVKE